MARLSKLSKVQGGVYLHGERASPSLSPDASTDNRSSGTKRRTPARPSRPSRPSPTSPDEVEPVINTSSDPSGAGDFGNEPQAVFDALGVPNPVQSWPEPAGDSGNAQGNPTPRDISFARLSSVDDEPAADLGLDKQVIIDTSGEVSRRTDPSCSMNHDYQLQHHGSTSLLYTNDRNRMSWTTSTCERHDSRYGADRIDENNTSEREALRANARLAHLYEMMAMKDIE